MMAYSQAHSDSLLHLLKRATRSMLGMPQPLSISVPIDHDKVLVRASDDYANAYYTTFFGNSFDAMRDFCRELRIDEALPHIPQSATSPTSPFWNNGFFSGDDARVACALARKYQPTTIVEIGSGNSTKFFRHAISEANLATKLVSIDPSPRADIRAIVDTFYECPVQSVSLDVFAKLKPNDILFFDGSHLAFDGSDTSCFFLDILPLIGSGVLVHVHDIFLPQSYPPHFSGRFYNEQTVLAAFLMFNRDWDTILPVHYLHLRDVLHEGGCSLWMQRNSKSNWGD